MTDNMIHLGPAPRQVPHAPVTGELADLEGEAYYRICNYDRMRPFFMTIVSDSNHWMFLSTTGGVTAGRKNPSHALFPYVTDDKIHDAAGTTGSKTLFLVTVDDRQFLWEPFTALARDVYAGQRHLWKSLYGNKVFFQEVNHDLGLSFWYGWQSSVRFGWMKRARVVNHGGRPVQVRLLDGLQNLLPAGTDRMMQATSSTLLDAYKRNELDTETGLGLFRLSSIPIDRPEPSESLRVTTVWSEGLPDPLYLLSARQLEDFRQGHSLQQETDVRAERGAYFVQAAVSLSPAESLEWSLVAELDQGPAQVAALRYGLRDKRSLRMALDEDVHRGTDRLKQIVAQADGLQMTGDRRTTARHFANVLFNVMRGGIFAHNGQIAADDLRQFVMEHNREVAERHGTWWAALPEHLSADELHRRAAAAQDTQLERLCYEYLPLTFSRRHGDPSRPWNEFSIDVLHEDGQEKLSYQGNWRDIFQNWEALGRSYPDFLPGMICRFLSASTADGYNPYRVSRQGIDWEVTEPDNPWSFIGYWGDHQIVYLLKLLEAAEAHRPAWLKQLLTRDLFAYANVPYRIRPYRDLVADPHHTIDYDRDEQARVDERVARMGADGRLLLNRAGQVHLVNLAEKLLVSTLAKFSNFVPEAGIWMNTQRPEWNDANNALVGRGASMVTLYYLRRFQQFVMELYRSLGDQTVTVSEEVALLLESITQTFARHAKLLDGPMSDRDRRMILDELGAAGSRFRTTIYRDSLLECRVPLTASDLIRFCEHSLEFIDHSIRANRRDDSLFHAYNLISFSSDQGITIRRLYEMLEGQVAVLSSGVLTAEESSQLLSAMRNSALYREDQRSYLLYPDRHLPDFLALNRIPPERVANSPLLERLVARGDTQLIVRDVEGEYHFQGRFRNSASVNAALDRLRDQGEQDAVERERENVLALWEELFDHQSYTGRSGTFFGYEGLGCIYWHMVSKLLLAIQETYCRAARQGASEALLAQLADCYEAARDGIGVTKNPAEYGAFPTDPYSHTPGNAGVQQPGMTGQVKEDILCRWGELGVWVDHGRIHFRPALLRDSEFWDQETEFQYVDHLGEPQRLPIEPHSLAFTYCQTPVVYRRSTSPQVTVHYRDGTLQHHAGLSLDKETSAEIFGRTSRIATLQVDLTPGRG